MNTERSWPPSEAVMSKYWLHYSRSAKWSHQSRTQPCTVVFFLKGVISGLIPASAGALLSAVHISMCRSASGSGFSELLLGAVGPSRRRRVRIGSWISKSSCSGASSGHVAEPYLSPHGPRPRLHTCHRTGRAPPQWRLSVDFLCWQARRDQLHGVER